MRKRSLPGKFKGTNISRPRTGQPSQPASGGGFHGDRRQKRENRKSWRRDLDFD